MCAYSSTDCMIFNEKNHFFYEYQKKTFCCCQILVYEFKKKNLFDHNSPSLSFQELLGVGRLHTHHTQTDMADSKLNRLKGRFSENALQRTELPIYASINGL